MEFLEFTTSEIASAGCRLTAALFGGILTTPDSNTWSASYDAPHPLALYFRSSRVRVHVPTLSRARAALNYECKVARAHAKVARAHAKVARAHARVCRGLATPLVANTLNAGLCRASMSSLLVLSLVLLYVIVPLCLAPVACLLCCSLLDGRSLVLGRFPAEDEAPPI